MSARNPPVSVIIATFNRLALLERLLAQLAVQALPAGDFEVVVVDDGSAVPARPRLEELSFPYSLHVEAQPNAGAASARHRGILAARGETLVILDDDMQIGPDFLASHLAAHRPGEKRVVLGQICPDAHLERLALFERWHQHQLDRFSRAVLEAREKPQGLRMYTGNVSMRRADYLEVGGFDPTLARAEDFELGLRLEGAGCAFAFSPEARSFHGSDHTSGAIWRRRAFLYGAFEHRIARKHPHLAQASPWRFLFQLSPLSRPLLWATLLAPALGRPLGGASHLASRALDAAGAERLAMHGLTLTFGLDYFRGLRSDTGSLSQVLREIVAHAQARRAA